MMALAGASVPVGLRHTFDAAAGQPAEPQIQTALFGVHFAATSGKLLAWRKGAPLLTNAVARAVTATGVWSTGDSDYTREIDEALTIERLSEEHATVRVIGETRLEPGDRVRVVPNHSCVVSNLVDVVRLVDGDQVIDTLPVAARGRIQ